MGESEQNKNLHEGHRRRVKQNAADHGFSSFQDHQLLELLLYYSIPRADTNELAHKLLSQFGNLDGVFHATFKQLSKVQGVGESTALLLASMGEAFARARSESFQKLPAYKTTESLFNLSKAALTGENREKLMVFCFDAARRLKKEAAIAYGTETEVEIDLRRVVETVIDSGGSLVVLAHNHPSGKPEPSGADVDATRAGAVMLRKLGFLLFDHIIVGDNGSCYSMSADARFAALFS